MSLYSSINQRPSPTHYSSLQVDAVTAQAAQALLKRILHKGSHLLRNPCQQESEDGRYLRRPSQIKTSVKS